MEGRGMRGGRWRRDFRTRGREDGAEGWDGMGWEGLSWSSCVSYDLELRGGGLFASSMCVSNSTYVAMIHEMSLQE